MTNRRERDRLFIRVKNEKIENRDFPGGPVVKMLHFYGSGHGFNPWSGN